MFEKLLTLLCALMLVGATHAQSIWSDVPESSVPAAGVRYIQPSKFRSIQLDVPTLKLVFSRSSCTIQSCGRIRQFAGTLPAPA